MIKYKEIVQMAVGTNRLDIVAISSVNTCLLASFNLGKNEKREDNIRGKLPNMGSGMHG